MTYEELKAFWDKKFNAVYDVAEAALKERIQGFLNTSPVKFRSFSMGMGTYVFYTEDNSTDGYNQICTKETHWEYKTILAGDIPEELLDFISFFIEICGTPNIDMVPTGKRFLELHPDAEYVVQGHDNGGYEVISTTHDTPYPIFIAETVEECNKFVGA